MSWWISLDDPESGENLTVEPFEDGGTYQVGGCAEANLNITYNYSPFFPFEKLDERSGKETIRELQDAVNKLGMKMATSYWAATQGNAGRACARLLAWARQHPEGIWDVR